MRFTTILICALVCIFVTSVKADDVASSSDNAADVPTTEPAATQESAPVPEPAPAVESGTVQEPETTSAPVADSNASAVPGDGDAQQQPVSSNQ
ncbi:unnamed protein product [Adineta ricciae]|uniref:Uncharacterized protein n=1 Tax=Adineta ricciae TaxID=249248 RepID=A0A814LH85_ADIRI|nr:unnamed protein product [Adineta ricciae]CAF1601137.1 unnamed protein product [Adineta ricciae]